jgi:hypothetical protein
LKNTLRYGILAACLILSGCSCNRPKKLDRRVSLWRMDKIPYGTKYAFENLAYIFPKARIFTGNKFPALFQRPGDDDTIRCLIIISPQFIPEEDEMNSLIRYAAGGNQVFISALYFADTVFNMLHLKERENLYAEGDSTQISVVDGTGSNWFSYSYPGYSMDPYFEAFDTVHTKILGTDVKGDPDFIKIPYAHGGAIFIHLNPLAFSNFFLLHATNKSYYDRAFSWIPVKTGVIEWSDYFRYSKNTENFSALHFILGSRSLRWAFFLSLILFLILFLVESKRKQRPISEIPALRNASEDFVKTVGRLYLQQKDNQNLAEKMVTAFLEHIRTTYNLSTSELSEDFALKLAFRAGRPVSEIKELVRSIRELRINADISDQKLMDLHQQFNQFTKPS